MLFVSRLSVTACTWRTPCELARAAMCRTGSGARSAGDNQALGGRAAARRRARKGPHPFRPGIYRRPAQRKGTRAGPAPGCCPNRHAQNGKRAILGAVRDDRRLVGAAGHAIGHRRHRLRGDRRRRRRSDRPNHQPEQGKRQEQPGGERPTVHRFEHAIARPTWLQAHRNVMKGGCPSRKSPPPRQEFRPKRRATWSMKARSA